MLEKPIPPGDYDCCESACEPCVWDIYYDELRQWQAEQKAATEQTKDTQANLASDAS